MERQDLEDFIGKAAQLGAKRIVLRQLIWDPKGHAAYVPLMVWDFDEWHDGPEALADAILAWAQRDASDTGGMQTYSAFAVADGQDVAQLRWSLAGAKLLADAGGMTEAPNTVGMYAQQMRHNEILLRGYDGVAGRAFKAQDKIITRLETQNDKLEAQKDRLFERELLVMQKLEQLTQNDHERQIEKMQVTRQLENSGKALAFIEPVVPMIVAKLLNMPLAPADTQSGGALDVLLTTITEDQTKKLMEILNPGQIAALHQLYQERAAAQKAAEEAKAAASSSSSSNGAPASPTNGAPAT